MNTEILLELEVNFELKEWGKNYAPIFASIARTGTTLLLKEGDVLNVTLPTTINLYIQ